MDVTLGRQILRHIDKDPKALNMSVWADERDDMCGTEACIAGWAGILTGNAEEYNATGVFVPSTGESWMQLGQRLLDLPYEDADFLFYETDNQGAIDVLKLLVEGKPIPYEKILSEVDHRMFGSG